MECFHRDSFVRGTKKETLTLSSWQDFAPDHVCDSEQKVLWRRSDTAARALLQSLSRGLGSGPLPPTRAGGARAARVGSDGWKTMTPSLEDTVFFVVGLKVFIHATGVGHLFAIDLWQELRVLDPLLLVEQDVSRVGVDLLRVHFLVRGNRSAAVPHLS